MHGFVPEQHAYIAYTTNLVLRRKYIHTRTNLRPSASDGLLTTIDPSQAPAMSRDVATSCCTVGRFRSRSAEPVGQVASSPEKHAAEPPTLSPATSTVLRADMQYLFMLSCRYGGAPPVGGFPK